jgi:flagellar FliL protein
MSAAAAAAEPAPSAPAPKGKKKLLITIAALVLVLGLAGGGGAFYWSKKKAAERAAAQAEGGDAAPVEQKKAERKHAPAFVSLEPFTVNLADREGERYAQVGMTLELNDPKLADQIKVYMPIIRNNVLMLLAHKTSVELLERQGKQRLAQEVLSETARALGIEAPAPAAAGVEPSDDNPLRAVHFSNFIIQ